jgi:hypothetical protein
VLVEEEEVPRRTPIFGPIGLFPLDINPLHGSILPKAFACWIYLVGSTPVWQQCFRWVFQFGGTFTWREMRSRGGFHRVILHY